MLSTRTEPDALPHPEALANANRLVDEANMLQCWHARERHVVLDTCFDYGLNFLATWRAWLADPNRPASLHYIAIEDRPYTRSAMTSMLAAWPELATLSQQILDAWPMAVAGFHRIFLADEAVTLTLIFGDLEQSVPQIDAQVDTFLLNGHACAQLPERNQARLYTLLGRLAAQDAVLVAEPALSADAAVWKNTGFIFTPEASSHKALFSPRWQASPQRIVQVDHRHAIVIGAGLAGSTAAQRLCARGWKVTLIEQHAQVAQEASGNQAGIFMPMLAKDDNPGVRLARTAFLFALRLWQNLGGIGQAFPGEACGVLQLVRDVERAYAAQDIADTMQFPPEFAQWLNAEDVARLPGIVDIVEGATHQHGGWLFQQGGWVHPPGLCAAMLAACGDNLTSHYSTNATRIERVSEQWQVFDERDILIAAAPHLVIANGSSFRKFAQTADLPLTRIRGQVTHLPASIIPELPLVMCREGYLTRPFDGMCSVGATYDIDDDDASLRLDSQLENFQRLDQLLPNMSTQLRELPLNGRVGFRCVSADRLPIVGALPDASACADFRGDRLRDVPHLPGLYGLLGYASRGLIWAPLAAEILAAQITGEPLPVERDLLATLDPARFFLNQHRRKPA